MQTNYARECMYVHCDDASSFDVQRPQLCESESLTTLINRQQQLLSQHLI